MVTYVGEAIEVEAIEVGPCAHPEADTGGRPWGYMQTIDPYTNKVNIYFDIGFNLISRYLVNWRSWQV